MPNFPSDPYNGATVVEELPNGDLLIWTYDRPTNTWSSKLWEGGHDPGLILTRDVQTTPSEIIEGVGQLVASEPAFLSTQEEVNDFVAGVAEKAIRATSRAADQVDFLQNSVGKGVWVSGEGVVDDNDEYPGPGEFWANGTEFQKVTKFKFNDSGLPGFTNPGSLEGSRVGDYLTVQTNDNNSFGQYVIKGLATENKGKAGLIIRTLEVALIRDARSLGDLSPLDRCSVTVARPMSVIVQDDQPVVSTRGIFWYREGDDHLLISNYADGFTGDGAQWTDLTAGGDGQYLPLAGGTMKGDLSMGGHKITAVDTPVQPGQAANKGYIDDNFLPLKGGTMTGQLVMDGNTISGVGTPTAGGMVMSRNYADGRYLQLKEGGQVTGYVQFKDDTKLQMGGTYNNNIIDGTEGFTDNSIVATLGFVNHAVANSAVGFPHRDKMYLQGFYPWRFGEGSQANNPGDWLAKTSDYNVVLDPADWKILYFSTTDAYGQDLAGKFMNHMDMTKLRELQLWFAREDGSKLCSYTSKGRCRDQNFENWFTVDMDASDKELVVSPHYDTASLEISRGEILWIKCSAWGN